MTIAAIRGKLHNYISEADDQKIKNLYHIFEDQMAPAVDWSEDEEFVAELDERVRRYDEGIDPGYTWEELEASISELKKKRAAKRQIHFCSQPKLKEKSLRHRSGMKISRLV